MPYFYCAACYVSLYVHHQNIPLYSIQTSLRMFVIFAHSWLHKLLVFLARCAARTHAVSSMESAVARDKLQTIMSPIILLNSNQINDNKSVNVALNYIFQQYVF